MLKRQKMEGKWKGVQFATMPYQGDFSWEVQRYCEPGLGVKGWARPSCVLRISREKGGNSEFTASAEFCPTLLLTMGKSSLLRLLN